MDITEQIFIIAFVGALISLDVTVLGQWMISRPLVSGMIIGAFLGDPWAGFKVGVIVELLWIDIIPVGVSIPLNTSVVAVLSSAWYMLTNSISMAALVLAVCVAIPAGILFKKVDIFMRRRNVFMVHWVDSWVREGKENRISMLIYGGIILTFLRSFIFYVILLYPGYLIIYYLLYHLPANVMQGLRLASEILPLMGIVVAIKSIHFKPGEAFSLYKQTITGKRDI